MKHLLITLSVFTIAIAALHAADPVVVVQSATSVTVDGVNFGKPADAIVNNPKLASAVQIALEKWASGLTTAKADSDARLAAKVSRINTVLQARLAAESATNVNGVKGPKTLLLESLVAEAATPEVDLKREALAAEIAAKQAELDKLK